MSVHKDERRQNPCRHKQETTSCRQNTEKVLHAFGFVSAEYFMMKKFNTNLTIILLICKNFVFKIFLYLNQ